MKIKKKKIAKSCIACAFLKKASGAGEFKCQSKWVTIFDTQLSREGKSCGLFKPRQDVPTTKIVVSSPTFDELFEKRRT